MLSVQIAEAVWKELLIVAITNIILGIVIITIASIRENKTKKSVKGRD